MIGERISALGDQERHGQGDCLGGVFEVKKRKARRARNPRTGEAVDVPGKLVVTFKPGREMKERVRRLTKVPGEAAASQVSE